MPSEIRFIERGWLNSNNILLVGGDGPVIVDTGHHADAYQTATLIEQQGVNPRKLALLVNTHCHWDHFGGNRTLRALSGAPLATSAATADIFARNDRRAMWLSYFNVDTTPLPADVTWRDGDRVELAGLRFDVLAAPGHAPDAIVLYQPDNRLLISADALHEKDCGVLNTAVHGVEALDAAIATVERLRRLDLRVVLPGHGPPITAPAASLNALAARLARFKRDPEALAWHFVRRVAMAAVLEMQPVPRADFIATVSAVPWVADYAPRCGYGTDYARFVADRLDEFCARKLVPQLSKNVG